MSHEHISVDRLISLAPPPEFVVDRVPPDQWEKVERDLGTPLPSDYKLMVTVHGSGIFNDLFFLFNPFAQHEGANLLHQARKQVSDYDSHLEMYEESKSFFPEECPFPCFPEPGGLLPLGGDTNGGYAFWLTRGQPDEWSLVFYPHGFNTFEQHPMPVVEFLVLWLSGKLPDCFFGVGKHFVTRTDPVFQN